MTADLRCPGCGSLVRAEADWCSLCHADLRPPERTAQTAPPEWVAAPPELPGADDPSELRSLTVVGSRTAPTVQPGRGRHAKAPADQQATGSAGIGAAGDNGAGDAGPAGAGTDPDRVLAEAGIDVQGMLELLAANQAPPLGPLSARLQTKGQRAVAVLVAAGALTAAALLVMFVLGLFVH